MSNTTPFPPPPPGYGSYGTGPSGPPPKQWYPRKGFIIPASIGGVLILLAILGAIVGDPNKDKDNAAGTPTTPPATSSSIAPTATQAPPATTQAPPSTTRATRAPSSRAAMTSAADDGGKNSWVMPDETGMDLQDAQNDIQHLTDYSIFLTKSKDASGQDRFQIIDHDWKVCSQNINPGERITADSKIVFNVVKQDETCP